ncbi:MAG: efflux transporter outer membrane subunit [Tidjanibacter sp.]|nr:efflux transporter outer membrane subunit [Tidjanibacter sp.]
MKKRIHCSPILKALLWALVAGVLLEGCAVTPPDVPPLNAPDEYIFAQEGDTLVVVGAEWWEIFGDTTLNRLIVTALEQNKNLAIAASNVAQAQAQLAAIRASFAPNIDIEADASATYTTPTGASKKSIVQSYSLLPRVSWEVSLFGGARASIESANEEYIATSWGYHATRLALEAQVATTYFQWLQYARSLEISERSYALRQQAQQKADSLFYYGYSSGVDLQQARSLTATAAADIPSYRRAMVQTNLILNSLIGGKPELLPLPPHSRECVHSLGAQLDGLYCGHLTASPLPAYIPSGLPSSLLERRPDIMEAYHKMLSAAAGAQVARAERLPSISLTGEGGVLSSTLKGLTSKNPAYWTAALSLTQPLLHFGQLKAEEKVAVEQWRQASYAYQQTILAAFSDVESALVAIENYNNQVERYVELLQANNNLRTMTAALYADGLASSLNLIDAERNLYSSQLDYIALLTEQLTAYVTLYKALGGGW